jgi:hypothetical protein
MFLGVWFQFPDGGRSDASRCLISISWLGGGRSDASRCLISVSWFKHMNAVTTELQLELTCECPDTDSVRFPSRYSKFTVCQLLSRNLTLSCVSWFCPWMATENSSLSGCTSREIELPPFVCENSSPPTHVRKLSPVCPWRDTGVYSRTYDEPLKKPSFCWALQVWRSKAREIRHTEAATEHHQ